MSRLLYVLLCLTACSGPTKSQFLQGDSDVVITVKVPESEAQDTMILYRYKRVLSEKTMQYLDHITYHAPREQKGTYHFRLPDVKDVEHIVLGDHFGHHHHKLIPILDYYPIYSGDSIQLELRWDSTYHANDHLIPVHINYEKKKVPNVVLNPVSLYVLQYRLLFSGRGAAKYQWRYRIDRARYNAGEKTSDSLLNACKSQLDSLSWGLLKADAIGRKAVSLYAAYRIPKSFWYQDARACFKKLGKETGIPRQAKLASFYYPKALMLQTYLKFPKHSNYKTASSIAKEYDRKLRDKLLAIFSLEGNRPDSVLLFAMHAIASPYYKSVVRDFFKKQKIGAKAYDFSLPDKDGKMVKLSDFRGKVVFVDFWFTGCHVCSGFYKEVLAEVENLYRGNDQVVFISISIDLEKRIWLKSLKTGLYATQDGINLYTEGVGSNAPVIGAYNVRGYPTVLLIDRKGRIRVRNNLFTKERLIDKINEVLQMN